LVANRGEIALRIIRAARELGLYTVAVYTADDVASPHVRQADRAIRIDSAQGYLDADALSRLRFARARRLFIRVMASFPRMPSSPSVASTLVFALSALRQLPSA
jgi:EAL domain-containing protein (putative c-di-GMP-specific phosphodiesterase class I)